MNSDEQEDSIIWLLTAGIVGVLISLVSINWLFSGNKTTVYEVFCGGEIVNHRCVGGFETNSKKTYKIDDKNQKIIVNSDGFVYSFENCTIDNRKDWSCINKDGYTTLMQKGEFHSYIDINDNSLKLSIIAKTKQTSKLNYYLTFFGIDRFVGSFMPNSFFLD